MRSIYCGLLLAVVGVCVVAVQRSYADDKVNVAGKWEFEVEIAGQQGMPTFTFKQDGEKLTGRYKGQFGEADVKGTLKGNEIEFTFEIQGGKVVYKGTVDKDSMKGD